MGVSRFRWFNNLTFDLQANMNRTYFDDIKLRLWTENPPDVSIDEGKPILDDYSSLASLISKKANRNMNSILLSSFMDMIRGAKVIKLAKSGGQCPPQQQKYFYTAEGIA